MNEATISVFSDVAPHRITAIYIFALEEFAKESILRPKFYVRIESNICTHLTAAWHARHCEVANALRQIKSRTSQVRLSGRYHHVLAEKPNGKAKHRVSDTDLHTKLMD